ncbi:serine/threonine-protein kinase [Actinocrispum sp. NPDC049592]|uniref:serine/threonine-protein kinase n=1 Tax=Actinocrispum sp. NPDC049592 TaxID=3154835 RepID=UPI003420BBB0
MAENLLENRYRLGAVVGRGGVAEVRRAWDVRLQRPVAIKLFQSYSDDIARKRFTEEAKTLACLSHPGLVTVYDTGVTEDGAPFLILHLVDGPTLKQRIPLPEEEVRQIGAQLADTLAYVHEHGITHRDVKPSNILLDADDTPYLADFGIAKQNDATAMTATGEVVGTLSYLAPEQVRGDEEIGHPVDIYALGLVLLECLTGKREYGGPDVEAALARLNRPVNVPEHVSPEMGVLLRMMTALPPKRRPTAQRCAELLRDPSQILPAEKPTLRGAEPVLIPEVDTEPILEPLPEPPRRRKAAVAALALVAAGSVALALAKTHQPPDSAPTQQPPSATSPAPSSPAATPVQQPPAQVDSTSTVVKTTTAQQPQQQQHGNRGKGSSKKTSKKQDED